MTRIVVDVTTNRTRWSHVPRWGDAFDRCDFAVHAGIGRTGRTRACDVLRKRDGSVRAIGLVRNARLLPLRNGRGSGCGDTKRGALR